MREREILPDYRQHVVGEREVVNWTRPDGKTYFDVPIRYMQQVTADDYFEDFPHMRGTFDTEDCYFWEVHID